MMDRVVIKKSALRALIKEMIDNKLPVESNPVTKKDKDLVGDNVENDEQIKPTRSKGL